LYEIRAHGGHADFFIPSVAFILTKMQKVKMVLIFRGLFLENSNRLCFSLLSFFLLFLLQFIYLPAGASYFEIPKVYAAEGAIFLLLLQKILFGKFQIKKTENKYAHLSWMYCAIERFSFVIFSNTVYIFW